MNISRISQVRAKTVVGIDSSTLSLAYCVFWNRKPHKWGKYAFSKDGKWSYIGEANRAAYKLMKEHDPDYVLIERPVFVNNRSVVKKLANVEGAILGPIVAMGIPVEDISPLTWLKWIDNISSKEDLRKLREEIPGKSKSWYTNEQRRRRKQATIDYVNSRWELGVDDDDVADAVVIAEYAYKHMTNRG